MLSAWRTLLLSFCASGKGGQLRPQASPQALEPAASGLLRNQDSRPVRGMDHGGREANLGDLEDFRGRGIGLVVAIAVLLVINL